MKLLVFFTVLNSCFINLLAMDTPEVNIADQLQNKGFFISEDILGELLKSKENFEKDSIKQLEGLIREKRESKAWIKNPELIYNEEGYFDYGSIFISREYYINTDGSLNIEGLDPDRITALENLASDLCGFLPRERAYYCYLSIISDKASVPSSDIVYPGTWHQDMFNGNDPSQIQQFDYLFFIVLDEYNFGDSYLELGRVLKYILYQKNGAALYVPYSDEAKVKPLKSVLSKKGAGYGVCQTFSTYNDDRIVHRTPPGLKKCGDTSFRDKLVVCIKKLRKNY